jgi:hypothetical protein
MNSSTKQSLGSYQSIGRGDKHSKSPSVTNLKNKKTSIVSKYLVPYQGKDSKVTPVRKAVGLRERTQTKSEERERIARLTSLEKQRATPQTMTSKGDNSFICKSQTSLTRTDVKRHSNLIGLKRPIDGSFNI